VSTKPPIGQGKVWTPFWRRFVDQRATDLRDTISLQHEVTSAWKANFWSNPEALETVTTFIFKKLNAFRPIPTILQPSIREAIKEILQEETHIFSSADIDLQTTDLSLKEQVGLRRFLRAQQYFLAHEDKHIDLLVEIILSTFAFLIDALPKLPATTTSIINVPLYELLSPQGETVERMTSVLMSPDIEDTNLFSKLRETLVLNGCRASGVLPQEIENKKLTPASESDLPPQELFATYLAGTPFLNILTQSAPFHIERERFNEHGAIFARSGHGKTQALRAFVAQFLQEPDPPALFLIDSLGALIEGMDRLEVFNTTLKDRLVILDPSRPQYMPRLNFFEVKSDDLCFYLFKAIDQSFTPRQATMISYLMEYMRHVPQPDILKLVELCESKQNKYPDILPQLSPFAQSFFEHQFFAGKGGDPFVAQTKAQIAQRLYTLGRLPKFNEIFSATTDVFDPYEHMQRKSVVLINTDARPPRAGGLGEGSAIFGRYILAQCLEAARTRPQRERHLALLVVDEAKAYMDDQAALILSDARQFGMGMLLASQQPHQLPEGVRREINTNTSIRMMGNIEYSVAAQYARDMFCDPEFILRMKKYDKSHAEWAAYVSGMDKAVKLNIPFGAIERMQRAPQVVEAINKRAPRTHEGPSEPEPSPPSSANTSTLPQPAEPAAKKQAQNERSRRDAELPVPQSVPDSGDDAADPDADDHNHIKPGKDW